MPSVDQDNKTQRLGQIIDHTKLTFSEGEDEAAAIARLCDEAIKFGFYAVCVRPQHVGLAKEHLKGSPVQIAVVIGFPAEKVQLEDERLSSTIGNVPLAEKIQEAQRAIEDGAHELDWVMNVMDFKADVATGTRHVYEELSAARQLAKQCLMKVIIETDLLTESDIETATQWCAKTGADMVKTSTGMVAGGLGATVENIQRIHHTLQSMQARTGIKASGGIKTREQALCFLDLGVSRLGTSSGVQILQSGLAPIDSINSSGSHSIYNNCY